MRRPVHHAKPNMTRAQNRTQYVVWLASATENALRSANLDAMAKRAGKTADEVRADIARQLSK